MHRGIIAQFRRPRMADSTLKSASCSSTTNGEFVRSESSCRHWIQPQTTYPPAKDRYHLFVSYACPWASRCLAMVQLKGLEEVIGISSVHPVWQETRPNENDKHTGWTFVSPNRPEPFHPPGTPDAAFQLEDPSTAINNINTAETQHPDSFIAIISECD